MATDAIEQVLEKLVDNARAHGTGDITLEARDAGSHLEVTVCDEGECTVGSEVFGRGGTTRSSASQGHGLAAAAELAEASGGHLSLDDAAPTTRFVLWLPAAPSR